MSTKNSILFVCMGNICRSPALAAILEAKGKKWGITLHVESCGLSPHFLGNPPDRQMQTVAQKHNIPLHNRAKLFEASFFDQFDLILCATRDILKGVQAMAHSSPHRTKLHLATHFSNTDRDADIPDPYPLDNGFEQVWAIMDEACQGILTTINR